MIYEIYKVEEKITPGGKQLKEMVLQGEGQSHTEERVAIWSDHPDFNQAAVGGKFDWVMEKKDSGVPIPAHPGKNYVNRTILNPGVAPQAPNTPANSSIAEMAIKTHIDGHMAAIKQDLKIIQEKLGVDPQGKPYPYPAQVGVDTAQTGLPPETAEELNPEDIPFNGSTTP